MVPRVAQAGKSFKGAALYYLHDKKAQTSERVAFVETLNLPTDDPDRATAHMIDTAENAHILKQEAGIKGGRKLQKPVYCYSLAWHPSETPTKAEQIEAAKETLKVLGVSAHQALIVAHTDTDHPHVHVIVNRVDPETGRAAVMSNDRLKLSEWAQKYEQDRGKVYCLERVRNNEGRREQFVKDQSPTRADVYAWKKAESDKVWQQYREDKATLKETSRAQYDALWQQRGERLTTRKAEIKQLYKPKWAALFKQQRKDLAKYNRSFSTRLKFALKQSGSSRILAFARALVNDQIYREDFIKAQESERKFLGQHQRQAVRDAHREITKAWKYDRDKLKEMNAEAYQTRLQAAKDLSDTIWKTSNDKAKEPFSGSAKRSTSENEIRRSSAKKKLRSDRNRARGRTRRPRPR